MEEEEVEEKSAFFQALEKQRIGLIRKLFMRARERREQVIFFQKMMAKRRKRPLPTVPCFTEGNRNLEVSIDHQSQQQNCSMDKKISEISSSQNGLEELSQISSVQRISAKHNLVSLSSTSGEPQQIMETSSSVNKSFLQSEANFLHKKISLSTNLATMQQNQKTQNNSISFVYQPIFHQETLNPSSSLSSSSSSTPQSSQFSRFPFSYVPPQQIQQQQ